MRSRISTNYNTVKIALHTAYLRSLLVYFMTSLKIVGLIDEEYINKYEDYLKRKLLKLPNDVKSVVVRNTTSWYNRPTLDTINML